MAGPLDSLRAGIGDPEARARLAAEAEIRAAMATEAPSGPSGDPYAPRSMADVASEGFGDSMYADPPNATIPDPNASVLAPGATDLGALAREEDAALEQAGARNLGIDLGGQTMGAGQRADQAIYGLAGSLLQRNPSGSRVNPMYAPVQRYANETDRATQQGRGAAEQILDAESELAASEQAYYLDEHARLSAEAQAQVDVEQVRQERSAAELEALKLGEQQIRTAADEFAKAPEIDPGRYWASRTGFQKFMGVMAAGAFGLAGFSPEQSIAHIRAAVDDDIDAQRFNSDLRRSKFGALREAQDAGERVYQRMREAFGDDRMAEHAIRAARFEESKARLQSMRAARGLPLQDAQHLATLAALDKEIAAERLQLSTLKARTLPRIATGGGMAIRGDARKVITDLMNYEQSKAQQLTGKGIDLLGEGVKADATAQQKAIEAAKPDEDKDTKLLQAHQDNVAAATELGTLIDDFASDYGTDVPGRGVSSATDWLTDPNARADAETRLQQIGDTIGRLKSGAAITPDEQEKFESWLRAGFGDEQLLSNLRNIKRMGESRIQTAERALPDRLRQRFRRLRGGALPELESTLSSASGRANRPGGAGGVVEVDE